MVNIYGSGGGGISSDDVTASSADVLNTVQTITTDSSDELKKGTMEDIVSSEKYKSKRVAQNTLYLGITPGAHITNTSKGYPEVYIPLSDLRDAIGYTDSSKVLKGTTIAGLQGTMTNNGSVQKTVAVGQSYTIPKGFHDGTGKVSVDKSYSSKSGFTYTPSKPTTNTTIQASGVYMTGNIILKGDSNLKPENIKKGVTIFGVTGTYEFEW